MPSIRLHENSRRDFIKKSAAGLVTALAAPAILSCANSNETKRKNWVWP
jgi:hypothetical protein